MASSIVVCCTKVQSYLPITLSASGYKLGVVRFSVSFNVPSTKVGVISRDSTTQYFLPSAKIDKCKTLVEYLNTHLGDIVKFHLTADCRLRIECTDGVRLELSAILATILGTRVLLQNKTEATKPINLHALTQNILICCSIVKPSIVAERFLPLIFIGNANENVPNPIYYNTLVGNIDIIRLQILNSDFESIDLPDGSFSVLLEFLHP